METMTMYYKLDENKNVIPCSREEWDKQYRKMAANDTFLVGSDDIDGCWISTVWIGLNLAGSE